MILFLAVAALVAAVWTVLLPPRTFLVLLGLVLVTFPLAAIGLLGLQVQWSVLVVVGALASWMLHRGLWAPHPSGLARGVWLCWAALFAWGVVASLRTASAGGGAVEIRELVKWMAVMAVFELSRRTAVLTRMTSRQRTVIGLALSFTALVAAAAVASPAVHEALDRLLGSLGYLREGEGRRLFLLGGEENVAVRASGAFDEPNTFGIVLALAIAIVVLGPYARGAKISMPARIGGLVWLGVLLMTLSRSALLALILMAFAASILRKGFRSIFTLLAGVGVLAGLIVTVPAIDARLTTTASSRDVGGQARVQAYEEFGEVVAEAPLFGRGTALPELRDAESNYRSNPVANAYLFQALRFGIPGMLLYTALSLFALALAVRILRRRNDPVLTGLALATLGLLVAQMFGYAFFGLIHTSMVTMAILGGMVGRSARAPSASAAVPRTVVVTSGSRSALPAASLPAGARH